MLNIFDFIDRNLFKGALRRGFKNYAYEGSHKRQAGKIMLRQTAVVTFSWYAEQTKRAEAFKKKNLCKNDGYNALAVFKCFVSV